MKLSTLYVKNTCNTRIRLVLYFQTPGSEAGGSGAFKGFAGFGSAKSSAAPSFSFGAGTNKPFSSISSVTNGKTDAQKDEKSEKTAAEAKQESSKPATNGFNTSSNRSKYLQQLKGLNESVAKWIKQHVDGNPYCILSPIFTDYEKHLKEIEKLNPDGEKISSDKGAGDSNDATDIKKSSESSTASTGIGISSLFCRPAFNLIRFYPNSALV